MYFNSLNAFHVTGLIGRLKWKKYSKISSLPGGNEAMQQNLNW